jgi:hypothetical protein
MQKLEQTRSEDKGRFTKIRQSGLEADLRAYAYSVEDREVQDPLTREIKTEKRAYLWYLDMVGRSREALKAIWAGLVNHSPKPAVLFREIAHSDLTSQSEQSQHQPEPEEEATFQMWVYLAERERAHGFRWKYSSLPKAAAHQGVLVPEIALARPPTFIKNTKAKAVVQTEAAPPPSQVEKQDEATAVLELIQTQEFLLLALNEFGGTAAPLNLAQLYYRRLDGLSQVPLLPQWEEWLWHYAEEQGLVKRLASFGCEAYLCRQPQEQELAQAISQALQYRQLPLPNHLMKELLQINPDDQTENNLNPNHHQRNREEAA